MEPHNLKRWTLPGLSSGAKLYTCARPGRSKGPKKKKVSDNLLQEWVNGLPGQGNMAVISLLGRKPPPRSKDEWSYYSFYGKRQSFQTWLDCHYESKAIEIIEHPTIDTHDVPAELLATLSSKIGRLLSEGRTVVVMDSGGVSRSGQVCRHFVQSLRTKDDLTTELTDRVYDWTQIQGPCRS
jgi:hypothetical protein